jgi:hypothetical protein
VHYAVSAASVFAQGPKGLDDYRVPIAWFERRLSDVPAFRPDWRHHFGNAFGGLLLRAGRPDEAIARIQEGIAAATDMQIPTDWTFLALAHARKGQLAEARQMLERLRERHPDSTLSFWDLQEIALLQSEARSWGAERRSQRSRDGSRRSWPCSSVKSACIRSSD